MVQGRSRLLFRSLRYPHTRARCRFFSSKADFELESGLYDDQALRQTLPACLGAAENEDGRTRCSNGFVFPPYLIMDRGTPLAQWQQTPRHLLSVLSMLHEVPPSPAIVSRSL